jgi:hypothetical protein
MDRPPPYARVLLAVSGTGHRCQPVRYRQALPLLPQPGSCPRLIRQEHRRDGAASFRQCGRRHGCPLDAQATSCVSLPPRTPAPPPSRDAGTPRAWARDTSGRGMAFPSACPRGPSRGLYPRASLTLLYPSLCHMSSPSNRRAAPHPAVLRAALGGMLRGQPSATQTVLVKPVNHSHWGILLPLHVLFM